MSIAVEVSKTTASGPVWKNELNVISKTSGSTGKKAK
jgi:hypothetical protein